jgi:glycosyltransferase involved in cell wall biosynthesis
VVDRSGVKKIFAESVAGLVFFHPEPNHVNAQPNKLFEYMASGLPVLASNFPLWSEIIEKFEIGFCGNPLSSGDISLLIKKVLDNHGLSVEMGQRGRSLVERNFLWENEVPKLKKLYLVLLK